MDILGAGRQPESVRITNQQWIVEQPAQAAAGRGSWQVGLNPTRDAARDTCRSSQQGDQRCQQIQICPLDISVVSIQSHHRYACDKCSLREQAGAMKISGNTIFIPGATSGIGLRQAMPRQVVAVIVGGRREQLLRQITAEHPGIDAVRIDTSWSPTTRPSPRRCCSSIPI